MRGPPRHVSAFCLLAGVVVAPSLAADAPAPCVRVGALSVSAAAVAERLAALPDYQRRALAPSPEELPRRFVETALVPELLLTAEAQRRRLAESSAATASVREVLRAALVEDLRRELRQRSPITDAEVERYYDAHRTRFQRPSRLRIWRILVANAAEAAEILAVARGPGGPQRWSDLARERSRDKSTAMRKGDLGFVRPDGTTDAPTVRVAPALYEAAARVPDGELVPEPVPEGTHLAVVWRRGSLAAVEEPLGVAAPRIRAALEREQLDQAVKRLVADLRASHLTLGDAAALEALPALPAPDVLGLPPPVLSAVAPARSGAPEPTDRGLR